jgi:X-Pro dipeptidyl-peptidase
VSGSSKVTVTATPTTSTAHLSAVLVDLGPDTIRDYAASGEGISTLTDRTCWGVSTTGDSACFKATQAKTTDVDYTVVSRGWADLGNHASDTGVPLTPGKAYTITLDLGATDHVVPAGHRLALIVAGTDKDLIDPPSTTPTLTVDLSRTSARVPLAGGAAAFARATAGSASAAPEATTLDGVQAPRTAQRVPGAGR